MTPEPGSQLPPAPGWALRALLGARVARLGTAGRDRRAPLVVPVCFAVVGSTIYSPVDGKPKGSRELRRVRDVRDNPAATLLVDEWSEQWDQLWWVRVDGVVSVLDLPSEPAAEQEVEVAAASEALLARYPQYRDRRYQRLGLSPGFRLLLRFEPQRITAWRWSGDGSRANAPQAPTGSTS